jgi:hypothetical protein
VCVQFDILWDDLSVRETLLFFVRLKGIRRGVERAHVDRLLHELGLYEARHRVPAQVGGGGVGVGVYVACFVSHARVSHDSTCARSCQAACGGGCRSASRWRARRRLCFSTRCVVSAV